MAEGQSLIVARLGTDETLVFAAEELARYLQRMLGRGVAVTVEERTRHDAGERGVLWLGVREDFGLKALEGDAFDDAIYLAVQKGAGIVAGANPRSTLLAVYRLLGEAGCRWVRPGVSGEFIPRRELEDISAQVEEAASYRHRGICIEGAVSYANVAEIIAWAPKVGFNAYFIQFREGFTFFERWYHHQLNPLKQPEPFAVAQAREFVDAAEGELKKRGMLFHAVGHGWTCEPFGIPGLGWDKQEYHVSDDARPYLAEVNGQRELWGGIPLNTNLCYSNPGVRRTMNNAIAAYLQAHPGIDVLHFWLADGSNNQCECEQCRKMIPADWYVRMLNELDTLLTARGITTKVVFLVYVDLLWPPQVERIANPERFILMFAPITRSYSQEFATTGAEVTLLPYTRNKLKFPANVDENVAFLKQWQKMFPGDSFDFDYHVMWDHFLDPGYYATANLLTRDIKRLREIGLNGLVSCQVQRAFFPTGLTMYAMGRTLWNASLSFDEIAEEYFAGAFGKDWMQCQAYLATLSQLFDPPYLRGEKPAVNAEEAQRFAQIPGVIEAFKPIVARNLAVADDCQAQSWLYLKHHAEIATLFARCLEARARGEMDAMQGIWRELVELVQRKEDALQSVLDVFEFIQTLGQRLNHV